MNEINMIELPKLLDDANRWSHLSGIQLPEVSNAEVELLIGQDVPEALEPSKISLGSGILPVERALGVCWNVDTDEFFQDATKREASYTKRFAEHGVFSL